MTFPKKSANLVPNVDAVFAVVALAQKAKAEVGEENITDASIGSLYDEDNRLVALKSVFDHYDALDQRIKAKYGQIAGNQNYLNAVYDWVMQKEDSHLEHCVVAAPGGTGAINVSFLTFLEAGESVIIPDIAWGSYRIMANQFGFNIETYHMFEDDHFNLASIKETIERVGKTQDKIVLVVNSPCHNPTGYSLSREEWKELMDFINEVSKEKQIILINDIAYIDYAYNQEEVRDYMQYFETITENVMIIIAFSCSKTVTSYGLRCGAIVGLGKNAQDVEDVRSVLEKYARAIWSNIPNAAMENFAWVVKENKDAFLAEKQTYIDLMKQRSAIFLEEARECGLPLYPYKEGFFMTIKIDDQERAKAIHQAFLDNNIFTVLTTKGIRVACCSLQLKKVKGLAKRMQEIIESI